MNDYQVHLLNHRERHRELTRQREADNLVQQAREARRQIEKQQPVARVNIRSGWDSLRRGFGALLHPHRPATESR